MAFPLGKITIIVGAGLIGSVLAKEGRMPTVSDAFSGAFKVWRQISNGESGTSKPKVRDDALIQQVSNLREQMQLMVANRSITVVTSNGTGSNRYGIIIVVISIGYGYVWWKGWKLSDMMFATKRSLSDACDNVSKKLENVYSSIAATKRHLSSRIDGVDGKLDECVGNTAATREEVSKLRGDLKVMGVDVESVHHVVRSLETKISRIEGKQGETLFGVGKLVTFVKNLEASRGFDPIEAGYSGASRTTSLPALEIAPGTPDRAMSLPHSSRLELPSPSTSNGSTKPPLQGSISNSGLKVRELSDGVEVVELSRHQSSPPIVNGIGPSDVGTSEPFPGSGGFFNLKSGGSATTINMVRRSCSAKLSFNI
ncbi:OLC1v1028622C1 [Oldenlandia corymbosa var. corymbosa]|uniref:OLC1v1028622C1 n=1 Tax=Oldenlandia corymbosa var. corymbosa TaxID=529605 RepID=A0AAV1CCL7_OLDCO|nr:OLC1v1028622C1 [Oldenlandia corymbosa var. corymbosa]